MATRGGSSPKPAALKLVTGNPGHRPIEDAPQIEVRESDLEPHKKLTKAQQLLWDRFINTAWWLTDHDIPKAHMWVCLQAEHDKKPSEMVAAKITQLRVLGSELGFDPYARARMGTEGDKKKSDPTEKYFS